ncbi:arginine--tRNA ligase [Candidatus Pacearchaeota archaeon]|nr:arginine--tRNA ligase [Candidatus Pacearchaeota archaeon]
MKDVVVKLIAEEVDFDICEIEGLLEVPPRSEMGDYAFPCFGLAKTLKKSPGVIAGDLALTFVKVLPKEIERVEASGAYVNFFIDKGIFARKVLGKDYGKKVLKNGKRIVIDMSSPNIAKPFGIGHLRSTIIGNSIARICEANGFEVVKINYLGDWGTQFGKIICAWKKWGSEEKLESDAIGHLQELYVRINATDEFDDECRLEFKKLESGDFENLALWKRFREMSLVKFQKIYDLLGISFDEVSGESLYNDKMDAVIFELKEKGLLIEDAGARIVDLDDVGLGKVLIQKSDGTSLYATRDLAMALDRKKVYDFDRAIYEVGAEQTLHFRQVFGILKKMGYAWADDLVHAAHGLYLDSDGKKFSTRRGKTVYMEDVLGEVVEKARGNLEARGDCDNLDERARRIALAAIFYGDLKNNREHNMVFDVDRFLSFEGDTGPYLLYSYARASSILRKIKFESKRQDIKYKDFGDLEFALIKKIDLFDNVVVKAYEDLSPNLIANYCFELAKDFNEFYHGCPVLGGESEAFRLEIVEVFRVVIKKGLDLLGIETLEEM